MVGLPVPRRRQFPFPPTPPSLTRSNGGASLQASAPAFRPLTTRANEVGPLTPAPTTTSTPFRPWTRWKDVLRNPERHWPNPAAAAYIEAHTPCIPGSNREFQINGFSRMDPTVEWISTPTTWAPDHSSAIVPPASRHSRSHLDEPGLIFEPVDRVLWEKDMLETIPKSLSTYLEDEALELRAAEEERQEEEREAYMAMIRSRVAPNMEEIIRHHEQSIFEKPAADRDFAQKSYFMTMEYHLGKPARPTAAPKKSERLPLPAGPAVPPPTRPDGGIVNRSRTIRDAAPQTRIPARPSTAISGQTSTVIPARPNTGVLARPTLGPPPRPAAAIAAVAATRAAVAAAAAAARINS